MTEYLLIFDVWAPFAVFRRIGTTTTSLTYSIMPRSAAEGLIGAILGYEFEESPKRLADSNIAIGIQSPVRKTPFSVTHTHTDIWKMFKGLINSSREGMKEEEWRENLRTLAKMNLLREPRYRIYFDCSEVNQDLERKLSKHETVFTPYLGSSSMIANFKYIDRYQYKTVDVTGSTSVASIIPFFKTMPKIHLEKDVAFAVEQNLPIRLTPDPDRILTGTYNAVYNPLGAELKVLSSEEPMQEVLMQEGKSYVFFIPTKVPSKPAS